MVASGVIPVPRTLTNKDTSFKKCIYAVFNILKHTIYLVKGYSNTAKVDVL